MQYISALTPQSRLAVVDVPELCPFQFCSAPQLTNEEKSRRITPSYFHSGSLPLVFGRQDHVIYLVKDMWSLVKKACLYKCSRKEHSIGKVSPQGEGGDFFLMMCPLPSLFG